MCNRVALAKKQFKREIDARWKRQVPVIEKAILTAVLMLGCARSMICADFLAGANLDRSVEDSVRR